MPVRRSTTLAALTVVGAQISINIGAALGKSLFPVVGPEGVAALRTTIAAAFLLVAFRAWSVRLKRDQAIWLLPYGLAIGGMNLLIYWAIDRIPIGLAVAIEICGPLAVVLFTSRSLPEIVWFALALTGLLFLVPWPGQNAVLDPLGVACAMGAAACWALYIVFGKRASEATGTVAVALGMAIACLATVPAAISAGSANLLTARAIGIGLAVALLSSALPYVMEIKALQKLSTRVFGVMTSSAPAIAAIVGFLILKEELTLVQWAAVALVMVASAGCSLTSQPALERPRDDVMT